MTEPVRAPWPPELVAALNRHQADGRFHPYTCPGDRPECRDRRELVASPGGWLCQCGQYRQDWAHGLPENPSSLPPFPG